MCTENTTISLVALKPKDKLNIYLTSSFNDQVKEVPKPQTFEEESQTLYLLI